MTAKIIGKCLSLPFFILLITNAQLVNANDKLQVHGFANIAASKSSSDTDYFFTTQNFSFEPDSKLGVQLDYRFNEIDSTKVTDKVKVLYIVE